jgi:hypothetical protein
VRIHHQDEPHRDGDVGGADLKQVDEIPHTGMQVTSEHPDRHGQKNPQGQESVQDAQLFDGSIRHVSLLRSFKMPLLSPAA